MTIFAVDPESTGGIRLHDAVTDTRNLTPYLEFPPAYRRPDGSGEIPSLRPQDFFPGLFDRPAAADGPVVPDQPRPPRPILDPPTPDPVPRDELTKPSGPSTPPPAPPQPAPPRSWNDSAGAWLVITPKSGPQPSRYRGEHRRPMPLPASLLLHLGANAFGSALGTGAVVLWAVTR